MKPRRQVTYTMHVPENARPSDDFEAIEMVDDSLADLGVRAGDVAVVFLTKGVRGGDVVAYETQGEKVVGRYYPGPGGRVRIEPMNDEYETDIYGPGEGRLLGRVVHFERGGRIVKTATKLRPVRVRRLPTFSWKELRADWQKFLAEMGGGDE